MAIDVIGQTLGNFGKWQLRTMLIIFLCKIPTSWFMAVVIFTAPAPNPGDFWCKPPDNLPVEFKQQWIEMAHPVKIGKGHVARTDYCHVYRDVFEEPMKYFGHNKSMFSVSNLTTVKCKQFEFHSEYRSLTADFSLVCGRELLLPVTQCFHIFGLLLGGVVAFVLLKFISPRRVMLIGMISQIICGNLTGLIKVYEVHVLFRCLSASSCALMYTSGSMILADITNGRAKLIVSIVFELFWSIGLILLPVFSLFITNWSGLYIGISTPTIAMVFLYRWLPDSPRWLLRFGRIHETRDIIIDGGMKNKRDIPQDIDNLLKLQAEAISKEPPPAAWCSIWDGNPRKRYLFAVHYAWCVYILLFNSVVLNIRAFGRSHVQINTVAIGFSEICGVFIGMYLILYTRRRWLWSGLMSIFSGCLAYFTWFIPDTFQETHVVALEMIPSMAIKMATSTGLSILTTCTADLVCMEKKKILMFSVTVWARAWFLWAPFIFVLKKYETVLPLTVFATLAIIGGILTSIVNHSHHKNHKKSQQAENIQNIIADESKNIWWLNRFSKHSYNVRQP